MFELQDQLLGALIGLARAAEGNEAKLTESTDRALLDGIMVFLNDLGSGESIRELIARIHEEKRKLIPLCYDCSSPCGRNDDYDMNQIWSAAVEIRSIKSIILLSIQGMAEYAFDAMLQKHPDQEMNRFFYKAFLILGLDDWEQEDFLPFIEETGDIYLKYLEIRRRRKI